MAVSALFAGTCFLFVACAAVQQEESWPPTPLLPVKPVGAVEDAFRKPESMRLARTAAGTWQAEWRFDAAAVGEEKAQQMFLAGTFNGWNASASPMRRTASGQWRLRLELGDGAHHYKFVADGERWYSDPENADSVDDQHGGRNSVLRLGRGAVWTESPAVRGDARIDAQAIEHHPDRVGDLQRLGEDELQLRLRTLAHDVESVVLHLRGAPPQALRPVAENALFQTWEVRIPLARARTPYCFVLQDGALRGRSPEIYTMPASNDSAFHTPDWAKDAVWYQIMLDRFRNGDPSNDPQPVRPWTSAWYESSDFEGQDGQTFWQWYVFQRHYGGDLAGLEEKLDYLQELGVNALYLNPVFQAPSHHKYNATDFRHVDEHFGRRGDYDPKVQQEDLRDPSKWSWTDSDRHFLRVLKAAKPRGFRVILDGVWNHVGVPHPAFQDVVAKGRDSAYADWFEVTSWDPFQYQGWAGFGELPVFAKSANGFAADAVKQHVFDVTRRWMDPDGDGDPADGIDGWRLDVPNEVPMPFWHEWRALVKSINPDAYLSGEIWHRAEDWLDGRSFDAVMNYPFAEAAMAWIGNQRDKIPVSEIDRRLAELRLAYPAEATYVLMNLLDSHDTDRLASKMLNPDRAYDAGNREQDPGSTYNNARPGPLEYQKARLAVLLQMTYVGAPMIYYGDEVGMWGPDDPSNRKPMLWPDLEPYAAPEDRADRDHLAFYRAAVALRREHAALRRGDFRTLLADDERDLWVYQRTHLEESVIVALNAGASPQEWQPPADGRAWRQIWGENGPVPALGACLWVAGGANR